MTILCMHVIRLSISMILHQCMFQATTNLARPILANDTASCSAIWSHQGISYLFQSSCTWTAPTLTARATLKYVPFPSRHHCSLRRCVGITKLGNFWVMSRTWTVGDQAPWTNMLRDWRLAGGRTTHNFHSAVMDVILKGMTVGQAGNDWQLKKVPLKVGYRWIVVDIVCPLLFVINDGKQGDQLCGRANGHHLSQRHHHRSCDCQFDGLDNPDVQCTFLTLTW